MIRNLDLECAVAREIQRMRVFMNDRSSVYFTTRNATQLIEELHHATSMLIEFCHQQQRDMNYN